MSSNSTTQTTVTSTAAPYYVQVPLPAGYPKLDDDQSCPSIHGRVETKSKGDDFWKGCAAALCCCCLLDACFWSHIDIYRYLWSLFLFYARMFIFMFLPLFESWIDDLADWIVRTVQLLWLVWLFLFVICWEYLFNLLSQIYIWRFMLWNNSPCRHKTPSVDDASGLCLKINLLPTDLHFL